MRGCDAGPINNDFDARLILAIRDFALANSLDWENPKAQVDSIIYRLDRADSKYCKTIAPGSGPVPDEPGTSEPSSTQTQAIQKWAVTDKSSENALGLTRQSIAENQARLEAIGFDPNGIDGIPGQGYRSAIRAWQSSSGIPATGYLDSQQLLELTSQSETKFQSWLRNNRNANELSSALNPAPTQPAPKQKAAVSAPAAPAHGGWYRRSDGQYCKNSENANWTSWTCQSWKPRAW